MSSSPALWIFALTFTPLGALVGLLAYYKARQNQKLAREGRRAQGVVTRLEATELSPASDTGHTIWSHGTTSYYPVIAWTTADGRAMETRADIARPKGRTRPVGTPVEVRYDPANPSRWTLPAESNGFWWLFVAVGGLFGVVGLGFLLGALMG